MVDMGAVSSVRDNGSHDTNSAQVDKQEQFDQQLSQTGQSDGKGKKSGKSGKDANGTRGTQSASTGPAADLNSESEDISASGGSANGAQGSGAITRASAHLNDNIVEPAVNAITDPAAEIAKLNSDGDTVVMRMTGGSKLQLPVPVEGLIVGVGNKSLYGYRVTVEQVGDSPAPGTNGAPPSYEVTFDKHLQTGLLLEPALPGVDPAFEISPRTADAVTMRFATQEEAAEAVNILQRLALSETLQDGEAISAVASGVDPTLSNPATNPVHDNSESGGADPDGLAGQVSPSDEEMAFLRDNMVSFSTAVGMQSRIRAALKGANLAIEPRFDNNQTVTRTVELPHDGQPGRLTYTISTEFDPSTMESITLGVQQGDLLEIGLVDANIVDHGGVTNEFNISWDLPPVAFDVSASGRPVPEVGAYLNGEGLGLPDEISGTMQFELQTLRSLADPVSRTDLRQLTLDYSIANPGEHAGPVIDRLFDGDLEGAFRQVGDDASVSAKYETIRRDGFANQPLIGVEFADVLEIKGFMFAELGHDDILTRNSRTFTATDFADRIWGPEGQEQPDQYVVVPEIGLNIRSEASADSQNISDFQHGTFVTATGQTQADVSGREWVEVEGLDENDQVVTGWVDGQYLRPHAEGAMDGTGRINPSLEEQGYEEISVQPGDTIWDLAGNNGVEFQDMLRLNQDHIIQPGLIFPGDTVYIPGTGQPVAPTASSVDESLGESIASTDSGAISETDSTQSDGGLDSVDETATDDVSEVVTGSQNDDGVSGTGSGAETDETSGDEDSEDQSLSGAGSTSGLQGQPPVFEPQPGAPLSERPELGVIQSTYQVPVDPRGTVNWEPNHGDPMSWLARQVTNPKRVTATEADMLNGLGIQDQYSMYSAQKNATETADRLYPAPFEHRDEFPAGEAGDTKFRSWAANDGHQDAFRHAYWNALMTNRLGEPFARDFATAHEGMSTNPEYREAMDLYNNEVGRQIALAHSGASEAELAGYVQEALEKGELIVADGSGQLAWSDQVAYGEHYRR